MEPTSPGQCRQENTDTWDRLGWDFVRQMQRARETKDLKERQILNWLRREIGEKENVDGLGGVARPLNETLQ